MSGNKFSCSLRLLRKQLTCPSPPCFCFVAPPSSPGLCFISFVVALSKDDCFASWVVCHCITNRPQQFSLTILMNIILKIKWMNAIGRDRGEEGRVSSWVQEDVSIRQRDSVWVFFSAWADWTHTHTHIHTHTQTHHTCNNDIVKVCTRLMRKNERRGKSVVGWRDLRQTELNG